MKQLVVSILSSFIQGSDASDKLNPERKLLILKVIEEGGKEKEMDED